MPRVSRSARRDQLILSIRPSIGILRIILEQVHFGLRRTTKLSTRQRSHIPPETIFPVLIISQSVACITICS